MASSRALMAHLRALKRRLEEPPARGGGYRPKRSVNPHTIRPPRGPSPIAPKPVTGNRDLQQIDLKTAELDASLNALRRAQLAYVSGAGTDAEVQCAESRVQVMHDSPGGVQVGGSHTREPIAYAVTGPDGQPAIVATQPGNVTKWAVQSDDVGALAVPEERRPSTGAPIRRLLGYLIRQWLRAWAKRLES